MAILYGAESFACRKCQNLAYPSQRETAPDRALRQANKIRRRLGWKEGILNGVDGKPKGMHCQTFERLSHQHNLCCIVSLDRMRQQLSFKDDAFQEGMHSLCHHQILSGHCETLRHRHQRYV